MSDEKPEIRFGEIGGPLGFMPEKPVMGVDLADGPDRTAETLVNMEPQISITKEFGLTYLDVTMFDDYRDHSSFVVSDDHEVWIIFSRRKWWKPWTWLRKPERVRVPNGTLVNFDIIEKDENGLD
jgi:hypothetical protein